MFDLDEDDAPKDEAKGVELEDDKPDENEDPAWLVDIIPKDPPDCFEVSLMICN